MDAWRSQRKLTQFPALTNCFTAPHEGGLDVAFGDRLTTPKHPHLCTSVAAIMRIRGPAGRTVSGRLFEYSPKCDQGQIPTRRGARKRTLNGLSSQRMQVGVLNQRVTKMHYRTGVFQLATIKIMRTAGVKQG